MGNDLLNTLCPNKIYHFTTPYHFKQIVCVWQRLIEMLELISNFQQNWPFFWKHEKILSELKMDGIDIFTPFYNNKKVCNKSDFAI